MTNKTERQREHFNTIADTYFNARRHSNHLLLKSLMWSDFLGDQELLRRDGLKVLEAMCGYADGKSILEDTLNINVEYSGFDYSDEIVNHLKNEEPSLNIFHADAGTVNLEKSYDLIVLLGGLHHVPHMATDVINRMVGAIKKGGFFLNLEPTSGNWLFTKIRERIYARNSLFDEETEKAFDVNDLLNMFQSAGLEKVDIAHPGLLSYILYYNPDAFPALNIGGERCVRTAFGLDKMFLRNRIGKALSFATLSLWRKP
jgi:SAM-dependent methyltransferase